MSGVPGQRSGPPPKRSDQRRRRNAAGPELGEITEAPGAVEVPIPPADQDWHPLAAGWYESLADSGQSSFYEPSDWAVAKLIAENMSRELRPLPLIDSEGHAVLDSRGKPIVRKLPMRGASVSAYLRAMSSLLVTEGDRRRLRLELQRLKPNGEDKPAHPEVPNLDDYRGRLGAG